MSGKGAKVCGSDTPLEKHIVGGREIWVKREDLCVPPDGSFPHFAKVRGEEERFRPFGGVRLRVACIARS